MRILCSLLALSLAACADQEVVEVQVDFMDDGQPVFSWPRGPASNLSVVDNDDPTGETLSGSPVWEVSCRYEDGDPDPNVRGANLNNCIEGPVEYGAELGDASLRHEAEPLGPGTYWVRINGFHPGEELPYLVGDAVFDMP